MKKNFIYLQGFIALGLLTINTSCVDDNESESVNISLAYLNSAHNGKEIKFGVKF